MHGQFHYLYRREFGDAGLLVVVVTVEARGTKHAGQTWRVGVGVGVRACVGGSTSGWRSVGARLASAAACAGETTLLNGVLTGAS